MSGYNRRSAGAGKSNAYERVVLEGNPVSEQHFKDVRSAKARSNYVRRDSARRGPELTERVNRQKRDYRENQRIEAVNLYETLRRLTGPLGRYHDYYSAYWFPYGFFGFRYDIRPYLDMDLLFWNPTIHWLYASQPDEGLYKEWYNDGGHPGDYERHEELQQPFARPGAFYPTRAIADLAEGVSALESREQGSFRTALSNVIGLMEWRLGEILRGNIRLHRNDIVVTRYQTVDGGFALDGFISLGEEHFPFEALLNMKESHRSGVFIPHTREGQASPEERDVLEMIHRKILDMNGRIERDPGEQPCAPGRPC